MVIFNMMDDFFVVVSHQGSSSGWVKGHSPSPKAAEKGKAATNAPNNKQPGSPWKKPKRWDERHETRVEYPWLPPHEESEKNGGWLSLYFT